MSGVLDVLWHGVRDALLMAYSTWWALVVGFGVSAVVQAWVPRDRIQRSLARSGPRSVAVASGLGAASSSCSYAAVAIARALYARGASAATALAFQFASTNLVWELGLVLWVLIGWQFAVAEYVGGIAMIVLMAVGLRLLVSPRLEEEARRTAQQAENGHDHHGEASDRSWKQKLTSRAAWTDVSRTFLGDWRMLYKEISIGFLLAGFVAQLPNGFFGGVFLQRGPDALRAVENAVVGPLIAVASFVCSVGNVPVAAVLWSGGISFGGVLAFLFADLIVLPIIAVYRKYYGWQFTLRIVALMFVTMVVAALLVDLAFSGLGLIPTGPRPTRADVFGHVQLDYKLVLDILGLLIFATLGWLAVRPGASTPAEAPHPAETPAAS